MGQSNAGNGIYFDSLCITLNHDMYIDSMLNDIVLMKRGLNYYVSVTGMLLDNFILHILIYSMLIGVVIPYFDGTNYLKRSAKNYTYCLFILFEI